MIPRAAVEKTTSRTATRSEHRRTIVRRAVLQLGECVASSAGERARRHQMFHLRGELRTMGKCLDISGGIPFNGAPAIIYQCHGQANELWDYYFYP